MDINIKNYDEILNDDNEPIEKNFIDILGGHNDNSFVLCDGDIFYQLFDEIKYNTNCSYETYLNDFIKRYYDGEYCFHGYSKLTQDQKERIQLRLQDELTFAYRLYPQIMEEFITKVWDLYYSNTINDEWMDINAYGLIPDYKKYIFECLDNFVDAINSLNICKDLS